MRGASERPGRRRGGTSVNHPPLVLTPGEPAGIGPDLCVLMAQEGWGARLVAVASPEVLLERAQHLGLPLTLLPFTPGSPPPGGGGAGRLEIVAIETARPVRPGRLDPANGTYVLNALDQAADLCLRGAASALVTGPVHKGVINEAGIPFSGHTEYLAARLGGDPVMMLATPGLRVALVARRPFHTYLAAGVSVLFGAQAILIMGGVTKLLPLTGVTLPFVSYGGSSLLVSSVMVGLVMWMSGES